MKRRFSSIERIDTEQKKRPKNTKTIFMEGSGDILLKDFKLSEIKEICKKQKGCEDCPLAAMKSMGGVCLFSPIGTTPADWKIDDNRQF